MPERVNNFVQFMFTMRDVGIDTNVHPVYYPFMADLRIPDIDDSLMARLKAGAALARTTLKAFAALLLAEALNRREGKKHQ